MAATEFSGSYTHAIDPKGRATIPAAYREALGEGFTLALNQQNSALALYPKPVWDAMSERLRRIPMSDARGMAYVRMVKAFSYIDQQLDGQGRLLLPANLREKVGLDKQITFAGLGTFLEIWDADRFAASIAATQEDYPALLDYVNDRYFGNTTE